MLPPHSNNRAHAPRHFLTITGPNSRKRPESGERGFSYQPQRRQGEFLLSEPHGEGAKAEKRLTRSRIPQSLGAEVEKDFSASQI